MVTAISLIGAAVPTSSLGAQVAQKTPRIATPTKRVVTPDAADSVYLRGRELLNRGELLSAAELFAQVVRDAPESRVASNALYWRGYALYQQYAVNGDDAVLIRAEDALVKHREAYVWSSTKGDAIELLSRVRTARAAHGDRASALAMAKQRAGGIQWMRDNPETNCNFFGGTGDARSGGASNSDRAKANTVPITSELADLAPLNSAPGEIVVTVMRKFSSGSGLCDDLSSYAGVYWKLTSTEQKDMLIMVFGRSFHPSGSVALTDVAKRETNERLRQHAQEWLNQRAK